MQIRIRHFFFALGYDPALDADHTMALGLFHTDAPQSQRQYRFFLNCGIERPRFYYRESENVDVLGAVDSARWTGRNSELWGWYWPAWFNVCVGRRWFTWASNCWYWPSPETQYRRYMKQRQKERQEALNSAMITARIQDPQAPDWLILARAEYIVGI